MHWTKPATADDPHADLERKLWDAANILWAGADLSPSKYSPAVLGLFFMNYLSNSFAQRQAETREQDYEPTANS